MKTRHLITTVVAAIVFAGSAYAHRTAGLLQASLVNVQPTQIAVEITLTPGIDIAPNIKALLDADKDGTFSEFESTVWAELFMTGQKVTVDGQSVPLNLQSVHSSELEEMDNGHAEIVVKYTAETGELSRGPHTLVCANRYEPMPCSYQSNGLVPKAPGVRITSHRRDERQQELTLTAEFLYAAPSAPSWPGVSGTAVGWLVVFGSTGAVVTALNGRQRRRNPSPHSSIQPRFHEGAPDK